MKSAATVAALAALGLVAVNYNSEGSQLFLSERLTEEEMLYMKYVTEYGKSYGTKAEFEFRFEQFKQTLAKMAEHNAQNEHQSTVGHNQFSDWTSAEYKRCSDTSQERTTLRLRCSTPPTLPPASTGSPRVPSLESRTRVNADHAGLSPPPVPSRDPCSSPPEPSSPTLSSSSSIAPSKTAAAMVVSWTTPSSTLSPTHSCLSPSTHTRADRELASSFRPKVRVSSSPSRMSAETPRVISSELPSARVQSPLPSRPTSSPSRATLVVSSPTDAEPTSTTVSSPSDTELRAAKSTSSSRTPGVHHGVTTVM